MLASEGDFRLILRIYLPKPAAFDDAQWRLSPMQQPT
jgi:hypothetical protein